MMWYNFAECVKLYPLPHYTHAEYLAGIVPAPFQGLGGVMVKPRIRVPMGRAVV